ncbi:MAG: GGDEF domain-containing protein [Deferribacteraceae bacterium]|nr:GGDEF domain-containing protein [Deferribacteraceae bacterium]
MKGEFFKLRNILKGKHIKTVYQPIVSLSDGSIFGYEALSRISEKKFEMNIEQMFRTADRMNRSWELETLCRKRALENAAKLDKEKKLFLNVNSNIINDEKFKEGFTKSRLDRYGLNSDNIIFEITERVAALDSKAFLSSIEHYKNQNYGIALDDVGAGYSGLNLIANVLPNLIKLDMNLVRNIDKDETKQLLCKAMVEFGKNTGIYLVAEGIESEEELKTLINLDVDLGQGYFLGIPQEGFENAIQRKTEIIIRQRSKLFRENIKSSIYPIIGHLAKPGHTFPPDENAGSVYDTLKLNPTITEFCVVDNNYPAGFMTRTLLNELLGGRYGYSLNAKKNIRKVMNKEFLRVNYNMPVDQVSRLAMQRPFEHLYNPVVVEKDKVYWGIVTIKDLLDACTKIEIDAAMHTNPLTRLPGNLLIEKEILRRIFSEQPYCITYFDIDNFKAYNDAYGFGNGDLMLTMVAEILKESAVKNEFVGHIGGDDFIVICDYHEGEGYCQAVIDSFSERVLALYRDEDIKNGHIISKNRHGVTELYPLASLSIAGISNRADTYQNIDSFLNRIAELKKKCKRQPGNYCEII